MKPAVEGAFFEWLAGVIIGVIPLLAHAVAYGAITPTPNYLADWTSDLIFVVISTSGASSVSIVNRLLDGRLKAAALGKSALALAR